jgi:4-amino-4-deoxy-L-arabinose transferase-like glycosyltransferase
VLATALVVAAAALVIVGRLGTAPVYILNEAREGVYTRAMLELGDFVLPVVPNHVENGEHIPDKPPLLHWLSAALTAGRVWITTGRLPNRAAVAAAYDAWSLRLPSALAALLMLAVIAGVGRHLIGDRAALLGAATLLASWQFLHQARYGRVDMLFASCVTAATVLLGRALLDGSARALLLAAFAAGCAVLAKGPLGIALPALVGSAFVGVQAASGSPAARRRALPWAGAAALCAAVALPWYAAALHRGGMAVVRSQLFDENLAQFGGGNGRMSAFYYIQPWLLDSLPWNLLAVAGAWRAWRTRDPGARFCALWWSVVLAVFQISAYKRRAYLLPALPAGALLAGYWMDRWCAAHGRSIRGIARAAVPAWWRRAALVAGAAAGLGAAVGDTAVVSRWLGAAQSPFDGALAVGGAALAAAALGAAVAAWRRSADPAAALVALGAALIAAFVGPVFAGEIVAAERVSPLPLAERVAASLPAGESVTAVGVGDGPSLLLLFYLPDLTRLAVVPNGDAPPVPAPAGYYLLSATAAAAMGAAAESTGDESTGWRVLWRDTLRERGISVPLVFAQRRGE